MEDRGVEHPVVGRADATDDHDQQGPAEDCIDDHRRRAGAGSRTSSTPIPRIVTAGGTRLTPAPSRVANTHTGVLARPRRARRTLPPATRSPRAQPPRRGAGRPARTQRETGRTRRWSSLPSDSSDRAAVSWPAAHECDQDGDDQEAHAEHRLCAGPGAPSLVNTCRDRRSGDGGTRRLRDEPVEQRGHGDRHPPADDRRQSRRIARPGRSGEQAQVRPAVRTVGHDARPHVAAPGELHRDHGQRCGETGDRNQSERLGRGEGPELLHPTERGHPDEAVQAHAGVGDHPHAVAETQEHPANAAAWRRVAAELAGQRTDRQEHDRGRHRGERNVQRRTGCDSDACIQTGQNGDECGNRPECGDPGAEAAERLAGGTPRVVCPREQELPSPTVFFPRNSLVEVSRPQTAPRTIRVIETLSTVKPATVWSCGAGPNRALVALFDP